MKSLFIACLGLSLLTPLTVYANPEVIASNVSELSSGKSSQIITRLGTQSSINGSSEYFTGNVRVDPLFSPKDTAPFSGAYVTFEPGARSAWHIHTTGQHLIVTAGVGRTQTWGGPIEEIRAGDVIWCPPGVKHWHGASPTTAMTHMAITGSLEGRTVKWMEKVTDAQYDRY